MEFSSIKKLYKDEMPVRVLLTCIMSSLDKTPVINENNNGFSIHDIRIASDSLAISVSASESRYRLEITPYTSSIEKGSDDYFYSTRGIITQIGTDVAEYLFNIASWASKMVPVLFKDSVPVSPNCIPEAVMLEVLDSISNPAINVELNSVPFNGIDVSRNSLNKCIFNVGPKDHIMRYIYVANSYFATPSLDEVGVNTRAAYVIANAWQLIFKNATTGDANI